MTEVVGYKVFPCDLPILALVEGKQSNHGDAGQHHEKQPIVWIVRVAN